MKGYAEGMEADAAAYIAIDSEGAGAASSPNLTMASCSDAAELLGFASVNVTHLCKQAVIHLSSRTVHRRFAVIGAVNTVVLRDGKRIGHNTDWFGFKESLLRGLPDADLDSCCCSARGLAEALSLCRD